jgi:uncharacterized protein (TIGR02271 family)
MPDTDEIIQVVNETATIEKRDVVTGRVRVSTRTATADELVSATLKRGNVEVTRIPINREIDAPPPVRTEGDTTFVPVVEEILVVEKRWVLLEEIQIRQTTKTQAVELPVTLRKQHAVIERENLRENSSEEET